MEHNNPTGDFKNRWIAFLCAVFGPSTTILIILSVGLIYISADQPNSTIRPGLVVLVSIFSAATGSSIVKKWLEITEVGLLVTRGKSAIRNLKLLMVQISALDDITKSFLSQIQEKGYKNAVAPRLVEIQGRCNLLSAQTVNSIEDWKDIIPEADIESLIDFWNEKNLNLTNVKIERDHVEKELEKAKKLSEEEKETLRNRLDEKDEMISKLRAELSKAEMDLNSSIYTSGAPIVPTDHITKDEVVRAPIGSPSF